MTYKQTILSGCAALVLTLAATGATAQTVVADPTGPVPAEPSQDGETATSIGDIIVTARKREENLQHTPIAITAFNAAVIESRGVSNLSQLASSTPSLTFNTSAAASGSPNASSVFLRGVGQLDFTIFTDPGVGIYIDGVYVARSVGSALDFVDIDRIEVLRGPQGTLFGRNTIGGAINVISKTPGDVFGGSLQATTGSFHRATVQASVNLPITDTFSAKLSGFGNFRDGFAERPTTGQRLGDDHAWAGRAQFAWRPTEAFSAQLSLDGTKKRENPSALVPLRLAGFGFTAAGAPNTTAQPNPASAYNLRIGGVCATNPDSSRLCYGNAWVTGNPYQDNGTFGDHSALDVFGSNLTAAYDFGAVSLKSITAYRTLSARYFRDTDHTPFTFLQIDFEDDQHQFSQEFQLAGTALGDRLQYLIGAYYFTEKGKERYDNLNAVAFEGVANVSIDNQSVALFTENTFDITERLHLTAGLRYTDETKKFSIFYPVVQDFNPAAPPPVGALIVADRSEKERGFKEWNPRVTLSLDVTPNLLTYATFSQGFKSGGFNGRYLSAVAAPVSFEPEYVDLYELGFKFQRPGLRFNAAAFRNEYSDIQINYRPDPTQVTFAVGNAAGARINGIEAELSVTPIGNLRIDAGGSWLDAAYTEVAPGLVLTGINTSTPFALTPKYTANLSASYEFDLGSRGTLTPRADYAYRSEVFNDNTGTQAIRQPGYSTVNLGLVYYDNPTAVRFAFGVTNATDERYFVSGAYSAPAGVAEATYGRPREWYLSVKKTF